MKHNSTWSTANTESTSSGYFSFSGRLNRLAFFFRFLIVSFLPTLIIVVMWIFVAWIPLIGFVLWPIALGLTILIVILAFIASSAIQVRRLHDMGLSGLWFLLILAASLAGRPDEYVSYLNFLDYPVDSTLASTARVISVIFLLVLLFWPGTRSANKYGPNPLAGGAMQTPGRNKRMEVKRNKPDPYDEDNFWR